MSEIDIESLAAEIFLKFNNFTNGVRVMMLIDRGENNSNKGSRRWINKLISTDQMQFEKNLRKLIAMQNYLANPYIRLYSCVNQRDLNKSIRHFQHRQLDVVSDNNVEGFYSRINDSFCSSLMQPENRAESFFLLDWDRLDTEKIEGVERVMLYQTPNGWHEICKPFNPKLIEGIKGVEIKKDALLLLRTLKFD